MNARWSGITEQRMLVLDTSAVLKIAKQEGRADEALTFLLKDNWALFCPTPAMLETGLGPKAKVDAREERFWRSLQPAAAVLNQMNKEIPVGFDLTPISTQMWVQRRGSGILRGKINLLNIDTMSWLSTKLSLTNLADKLNPAVTSSDESAQREISSKPSSLFMDALILAAARNMFSGVWTDNPADFLTVNRYSSGVGNQTGATLDLVPLFTTEDLVGYMDDKPLVFPSKSLKEKIRNQEILSWLPESSTELCKRG